MSVNVNYVLNFKHLLYFFKACLIGITFLLESQRHGLGMIYTNSSLLYLKVPSSYLTGINDFLYFHIFFITAS